MTVTDAEHARAISEELGVGPDTEARWDVDDYDGWAVCLIRVAYLPDGTKLHPHDPAWLYAGMSFAWALPRAASNSRAVIRHATISQ